MRFGGYSGSGILSSAGESVYCLEDPRPNRIAFDLRRVMRTRYCIDRYQETYVVIDDFEQLFEATRPDFTAIYREVATLPDFDCDQVVADEGRFALAASVRDKKMGRS